MKYLFKVFIISLMVCSCAVNKPSVTSYPGGLQSGDEVVNRSVMIYNSARQKLTVQLGESQNELTNFIIKKHRNLVSPVYMSNPIIRIVSGGNTVNYILDLGKSYIIYWNSDKDCWDLKEIKKA
jgi:hypothetical protein